MQSAPGGERKRTSHLNQRYHNCSTQDFMMERSERASMVGEWKGLYRSAMVQLTGGLYGLTLVITGAVFSIAAALVQQPYKQDHRSNSYYLEALQIYIYSISLIFLVYLHAHILRHQRGSHVIEENQKLDGEKKIIEKIILDDLEIPDEKRDDDAKETRSVSATPLPHQAAKILYNPPGVTFEAKDVNFYLRLGAIVFGIGSMIQDGFRLAQLLQDGRLSFKCIGPIDIVVTAFHVAFTFFQAFYLFKSHKIVIHVQKCAVRIGFIHLISTNLCVWILTTVDEILAETLASKHHAHQAGHTTARNSSGACVPEDHLSSRAAQYLYPCTIQYSLVAAAIICQMYRNVGSPRSRDHMISTRDISSAHADDETLSRAAAEPGDGSGDVISVDCDKAHRGLFLGLFVVVLTVVSISCYFVLGTDGSYFSDRQEAVYYSGFIFFFTELALLVFAGSAGTLGFAKFHQLRFVPSRDGEFPMESSLLVVALSGVLLLEGFHMVSAISNLCVSDDVIGILAVVSSGAVLVQAFLQTVFIYDALRRVVQSPGQQARKPGRTLITFLLLCNFSLLVFSIFEVKRVENTHIYAPFYGRLAWSTISHVTVPMLVFFRFHSVVCLSGIWNTAYKMK